MEDDNRLTEAQRELLQGILKEPQLDRRGFMGLLAGGAAALSLMPLASARAEKVRSTAKILILGAGAAGLAAASQLANQLEGAQITLLDPRREHYYQPGYTLIAAGLKPAGYSISRTTDWLPRGVELVAEGAAEIDPESKSVVTTSGKRLSYDYLILATGLRLDFDAIEGFDLSMVGQNGIGAHYAGPEAAEATWRQMDAFTSNGGVALIGRPATEMKCAGAPLKYAFLTDDYARRKGNRAKTEIIYTAHSAALFGVPIVNEKLRMLFSERDIRIERSHVLKAIDASRKIATYTTPEGDKELGYDFINVIPPQRAPDVVRNSPLAWQEGPLAADGWAEVSRTTLRHARYDTVFAIGDIAGVPKGKTAASVKWQTPVAVSHIVADLAGRASEEVYTGYTSCPLITRVGRAMLIEFDYNDNLVPSFPGIVPPLEELWISWLMKEVALKATYLAMLRGRA